jgi:O-antigen/teichoic acid export membrane protein
MLGTATVVAQVGQLLWLTAGSRVMTRSAFGTVLAAQALYGVLQFVVDNGAAFHGARLAASGTLDPRTRASIVRVRLQLAFLSGLVMLSIGAVGGVRLLTATAPFAAALALWALFNYWEPYGLGDGRPWSAYLLLRSLGPPASAIPFLVAGGSLPLYVAGCAEWLSLLAIACSFRLHPLRTLRAAASARRGPWRQVLTVGIPSIAWQIGLASGTVMLAATGSAAAAAVLGVGVRLLTGVNQLAAVLVTALFPALASAGRSAVPRRSLEEYRRMIDLAARFVVVLASAALAIFLFRESVFVDVFLHNGNVDAERTAALALGIAGVAGVSLLVTFVLVAGHREAIAALAFTVGTAVAVITGAAIVAAGPANEALWMAGALATGQVTSMVFVLARTTTAMPELRRSLSLAGGSAAILLSGALIAAFAQQTRSFVAAACLLVAAATLAGRLDAVRSLKKLSGDAR